MAIECEVCACNMDGFCDCDTAEPGTGCSTGVCFGGNCVECVDMDDCPADSSCDGNVCVAPGCEDGNLNGSETAIDCGGPECAGCDNGKFCNVNADCLSGYCNSGQCAPCGADEDCSNNFYCFQGLCYPQKPDDGGCVDGLTQYPNWCLSGQCCNLQCNTGFCFGACAGNCPD